MSALELCHETLLPYLREPLASADRLARTVEECADLPDIFRAFYFECRLSPPGSRVDLLAAARRPERALPTATATNELHSFVSGWLGGTIAPAARYVWLERDDLPVSYQRRIRNVHVCVDSGYRGTGPRTGDLPAFDRDAARGVADEMEIAGLLTDAQREQVNACLDWLPEQGRLIHLSSMQERTPSELKFYIALPCAAFETSLVALDRGLSRHIQALEPWAVPALTGPTIYCDVTFREAAVHSLGIVYSQLTEVTREDPSRSALRERFLAEGLCTLSQDAALRAWMAAPTDPVCERDPSRRVHRWLDLKITSTEALSTKAYLGFTSMVSLF
jgi:hypothetical protein